jgi:hypothetical protein
LRACDRFDCPPCVVKMLDERQKRCRADIFTTEQPQPVSAFCIGERSFLDYASPSAIRKMILTQYDFLRPV